MRFTRVVNEKSHSLFEEERHSAAWREAALGSRPVMLTPSPLLASLLCRLLRRRLDVKLAVAPDAHERTRIFEKVDQVPKHRLAPLLRTIVAAGCTAGHLALSAAVAVSRARQGRTFVPALGPQRATRARVSDPEGLTPIGTPRDSGVRP